MNGCHILRRYDVSDNSILFSRVALDSVDKIVQGNSQPLDANIATPDGWKQMRDMTVGQAVITPRNGVRHVAGVFPQGKRPVFRIVLRDGSMARACNQHLWKVRVS